MSVDKCITCYERQPIMMFKSIIIPCVMTSRQLGEYGEYVGGSRDGSAAAVTQSCNYAVSALVNPPAPHGD